MSKEAGRVVFDCNIYAQAIITPFGHAARCINQVLTGTLLLFWSEYVIAEIRRIPDRPTPRKLGITTEKVEALIARVGLVAQLMPHPPSVYVHPVDPKDSHYVDLAVASDAKLIVSRDKHLLNLMKPGKTGAEEFREAFPHLIVMQPEELLASLRETR